MGVPLNRGKLWHPCPIQAISGRDEEALITGHHSLPPLPGQVVGVRRTWLSASLSLHTPLEPPRWSLMRVQGPESSVSRSQTSHACFLRALKNRQGRWSHPTWQMRILRFSSDRTRNCPFSLLHQVLSAMLSSLFLCEEKAMDPLSQLVVGGLGIDGRGRGKYHFRFGVQPFRCWW